VHQLLLVTERNAFSMLPPPFNVIPILFAPFHYGYLYYCYYRSHLALSFERPVDSENGALDLTDTADGMPSLHFPGDSEKINKNVVPEKHSCVCSCKQATKDLHHDRFLSISGTASDITLGILLLFPCAFYEIYLLLREVRIYHKRETLFWMCLVVAIIGFPFLYVGFVITLLIEVLRTRTLLVAESNKRLIVYYEKDEQDTNLDTVGASPNISLFVTVIRFIPPANFPSFLGFTSSRSLNLFAEVRIGKQFLTTPPVKKSSDHMMVNASKKI